MKELYLKHRLSIPHPKCLGSEVFWIWGFLKKILQYLHIHNEKFLGWDTSLNIKSIYVSYTSYMHNLKLMLYNFFSTFMHESMFWLCFDCDLLHEVMYGIIHCGVMVALKKFHIAEHFRFQVTQPVLSINLQVSSCTHV